MINNDGLNLPKMSVCWFPNMSVAQTQFTFSCRAINQFISRDPHTPPLQIRTAPRPGHPTNTCYLKNCLFSQSTHGLCPAATTRRWSRRTPPRSHHDQHTCTDSRTRESKERRQHVGEILPLVDSTWAFDVSSFKSVLYYSNRITATIAHTTTTLRAMTPKCLWDT